MIEKIRMFLAVVTEKGVSKAAKFLHVTQPAVSQGLQELENMMGTALFERKGRQLVLTKNGYRFLPYAQQLVELHDSALHLFKNPDFSLSIGSSMTVAAHLFLDVVETFEANIPTKLKLYVNNIGNIYEMMDNSIIDVAFIEGTADSTKYMFHHLGVFELEFVATPKYLSLTDGNIENFSFLVREIGSSYRMQFEAFCRQKKVLLTPKWESVTNDLLKEAALRHQGVALLPKELISESLHAGELETIDFGVDKLTEPYGIIVDRVRMGDSKTTLFTEFVLSHFRQKTMKLY